jgi:Domain of unknown function (DUF4372)
MYTGKLVFAQLMGHLPLHTFRRCVARYEGNRKVRRFTCLDQYLCMAFAQLSLYTMLQVLSLTPFEKMPMDKAFFDYDYSEQQPSKVNQLNLFD